MRLRSCASDVGIELGNGVFVNAVESGGLASRAGVEPGHRIVHVNNVPVYDAKHAEQLIRCEDIHCFNGCVGSNVTHLWVTLQRRQWFFG